LAIKKIEPNWIAGFVDGEGCFDVKIYKCKTTKMGFAVQSRFRLTQHSRDYQLMKNLVNYLKCGNLTDDSKNLTVYLTVTKFADINEKIIPFFNKYPIQGNKRLDYLDFSKVAKLMENKAHLTQEGLEQIRQIEVGMNTRRELILHKRHMY
jgi:hypothetical protein